MRLNPRRVMFFGGPNAGMAQQLLDGANIVPMLQQATGKRIAEAMGGSVYVGNFSDALDRAPKISGNGCGLGLSAPEEVVGVFSRQRSQLTRDIGRQVHFQRNAGFLKPQEKVVVGAECGSLEYRGVGSAKPAVQQQEQEASSATADVRCFLGIIATDLLARGQQCLHLILGVGHRRHLIDARRRNAFKRIIRQEFSLAAPAKEEPQVLQFLALCGRRDVAKHAPLGNDLRGDLRQLHIRQRGERASIAFDGGLADVAGRAFRQVFGGDLLERFALRRLAGSRERQGANLANSLLPIVGLQAAPPALAAERSIAPDRAGAEREILPLVAALAGLQVATVRRDCHRIDISAWRPR